MNHEYVIVLTTLPADADGPAFARGIVESYLAACVNLLPPMVSVYRWEGAVEQETERQVVIKTSRDRVVTLWEKRAGAPPVRRPRVPRPADRRRQRRVPAMGGRLDGMTPNLECECESNA